MAVRLSSNISTKNPADVYATHLDNLGKGGVHTKSSIAQMNGITLERRTRLMLCVVADVGNGSPGLYWLNTPPNPTPAQLDNNQYWEPIPLGTTINGILPLRGFESAGSLTILDGTGSTGDTYIVDTGGSVNNPNIFGGQAVTLIAGDYLVYESGIWNVISTGATSVNWNTLTGKPTTFTPTAHTHVIADITDFPDISGFLEDADVVSQIVSGENPLKLANVQAIITYITSRINAIDFPETDLSNYYTQGQVDTLLEAVEGYILYTQPSLTALNTNVQNPEEGAFAYIQGEYSMYRRESNVWVKKYETSLPSSDEAKYLNINVNTIAELKDLGTVSLSLNNYILFRNTDDADALYAYQLVTGTDTQALPDVVRPDDYAASTNEKVWKRAVSSSNSDLQSVLEEGSNASGIADLNISTIGGITGNQTNFTLGDINEFSIEKGSLAIDYYASKFSSAPKSINFYTIQNLGEGEKQTGFFLNDSLFQIKDEIFNKGFAYNADYSANNTGANDNPRWIPDKAYVDASSNEGTSTILTEDFVSAGSNIFTLTNTAELVFNVYINGVQLSKVDYTVSGTSLTLTDTLASGDEVSITYAYDVNLGLTTDYYTKAESDANVRVQQALVQRTGTVIAFDRPASYGDVTAETGNITFDFTNAISGTTQVLKHNSGTKPTMPASANKLSGDYELSVDNQIYLTPIFISGSTWRVDVTVSQNNTW